MCQYAVQKNSQSVISLGTIAIVVFLDDVQLPPVCDSPVYSETLYTDSL